MSSLPKLQDLPTLPEATRPGVLLLVADYNGTLASARSLGRAGVDVTVADWRRLVPAMWSKFTKRALRCPDPTTQPRELIAWLLEVGRKAPGMVLLPTTDDIAWLYARHQAELQQYFVMDAPSLDGIYRVLNKWKLGEACRQVGIETPDTWLGEDHPVEKLKFPLLVKPQTQTLLYSHQKGRVVREPSQLKAQCADFKKTTGYADALTEVDPNVGQPMLQRLVESRGIYGLSGFIDSTGDLFVVSAARKVLQKPQVMGVGLCFQQAKVDAALVEKVRALCREVGYHGIFEIEFLENEGRFLLIDFNPRSYGQMAFDISRGADLPLMAYLHAVGKRDELRKVVEAAHQRLHHEPSRAWCDRISLEMFFKLRQLFGTMDAAQSRTWSQWITENEKHLTDAVIDREDWVPGVVAAVSVFWQHARHPGGTLRAVRES